MSDKPLQSAQSIRPIYHYPDRKTVVDPPRQGFGPGELPPLEPRLTTNRVFLTDGSVISFAETVAEMIEASKLGEIVGEPTAGTNGNIVQTRLPGGYFFRWTGMKVLKHDGSQHHGVGIQPTVRVSKTIKGIAEGRDEQLEKALELLK